MSSVDPGVQTQWVLAAIKKPLTPSRSEAPNYREASTTIPKNLDNNIETHIIHLITQALYSVPPANLNICRIPVL
jgi:hypothetical protein